MKKSGNNDVAPTLTTKPKTVVLAKKKRKTATSVDAQEGGGFTVVYQHQYGEDNGDYGEYHRDDEERPAVVPEVVGLYEEQYAAVDERDG